MQRGRECVRLRCDSDAGEDSPMYMGYEEIVYLSVRGEEESEHEEDSSHEVRRDSVFER